MGLTKAMCRVPGTGHGGGVGRIHSLRPHLGMKCAVVCVCVSVCVGGGGGKGIFRILDIGEAKIVDIRTAPIVAWSQRIL